MTDDTKDLADCEKLNLILAKLYDIETRLAKLEAQKTDAKRPRPDRDPHSDVWLDYRDAAEMMRCPTDYFRKRNGLGELEYWPEIERWQPGGYRMRLYVRREQVEAWIEASRTPPTSRINMKPAGIGYEGAVPTLLRSRAYRVMKSFGLERYIPAVEIKKPANKKGAAK